MRCLNKNKQAIAYKTYSGKTQIVDSNGYKTGEYEENYSSLVETDMNIAPNTGNASFNFFGIKEDYQLVAITDDTNCTMDESSIVWVGTPTSNPHNYIVLRRSKSLNSIAYALKEVAVSNA